MRRAITFFRHGIRRLAPFVGPVILLAFSFWLMWHTFGYDGKTHEILIATKPWSDFGAHIPLIRSFSKGHNWPPEYPVYPGEPIRYHYLFYAFVGLLERIGLRMDVALNLPSALGFFGAMALIGIIATRLFRSRLVGTLSVAFVILNGSLSFVRFLANHPVSWQTPMDIIKNEVFPGFAPYGPGEVSAFWNLNIYTNQRHLAPAFGLVLLHMGILLAIRTKPFGKQAVWILPLIGIAAILPWFHQPMLLMLAVIMAWYFLVFPGLRRFLILIGVLSALVVFPQIQRLAQGASSLGWYPGYLIHDSFTFPHFLTYWYANIGLHIFLIPVGFILAPTIAKKALAPMFFIFAIGNMFRFSTEIAANHKFFNFAMILGGMCTAWALVRFVRWARESGDHLAMHAAPFLAGASLFLLTFSGIVDLFPIINDRFIPVRDAPADPAVAWIERATPPDAVFLNSSYFYHPASLAGRKIFLGWPYFAWSAGYEGRRHEEMRDMYESHDPTVYCSYFRRYGISYVTIENTHGDRNLPDIDIAWFLERFRPAYADEPAGYYIFDTGTLCP